MKTFTNIISIIIVGFFFGSCADKMYVEAPCNLEDLNINGSLAQELGMMENQDATADLNTAALDLSINYGTGENYRVQIFSADPEENENSYLLAYYILNDESTTELLCNLPENTNNLYVGITDETGHRTVKSVAMQNGRANATFETLMASSK